MKLFGLEIKKAETPIKAVQVSCFSCAKIYFVKPSNLRVGP